MCLVHVSRHMSSSLSLRTKHDMSAYHIFIVSLTIEKTLAEGSLAQSPLSLLDECVAAAAKEQSIFSNPHKNSPNVVKMEMKKWKFSNRNGIKNARDGEERE